MGPGEVNPRREDERGEHDSGSDSRRPALIGLALVLVLVVASYFLVTALKRNSELEDCLMSGQRNCGPVIEAPAR